VKIKQNLIAGAVVLASVAMPVAASAATGGVDLSPTYFACHAAEKFAEAPSYANFTAMHNAVSNPQVRPVPRRVIFRYQGDILAGRGPATLRADVAGIYRVCGTD
jgi:hypothetical protein